jgi:hypothetical protein
MTLSTKGLFVTLSIKETRQIKTFSITNLSLCWESRFIYCYAECHYPECHYAECRGAEKQILFKTRFWHFLPHSVVGRIRTFDLRIMSQVICQCAAAILPWKTHNLRRGVPTGGQIWQRFSRTDIFVQKFLSKLSTSTSILAVLEIKLF